jgi:hypothetical protein
MRQPGGDLWTFGRSRVTLGARGEVVRSLRRGLSEITTREPSMRKVVLFVALVAAVAAIAGAAGTGKAFAYGRADQPIAQVEISGNCNDPTFDLCQHVGLGGVWAWAELDTAGGITSSGTMDYTLTFCGHAGPGGGPHSAGAFGHPGEGVWWTVGSLGAALAAGAAPFFDTSQTYSAYYVLDFETGIGPDDFIAVVPASYGHYGWNPVPAVTIQTQVAP